MFGNLGFGEILLILVVVLLLFGAKRLPEVGASIGKGIREFKRSISDTQDAIMGSDDQQRNVPPRPMDAPPQSAPARESPSVSRSSGSIETGNEKGSMTRVMPPLRFDWSLHDYDVASCRPCWACNTFFRLSTTFAASRSAAR